MGEKVAECPVEVGIARMVIAFCYSLTCTDAGVAFHFERI